MVMFDSLNRHLLPPYGCDWTLAPNFARLARRAATFERSLHLLHAVHAGAARLPHRAAQLPARPVGTAGAVRRLGTRAAGPRRGLHPLGVGPLPLLGGWRRHLPQPLLVVGISSAARRAIPSSARWPSRSGPAHVNPRERRSDWVNRQHVRADRQFSQSRTFAAAQQFLHRNHAEDNWFLQVECFDPHEPFTVHRSYRDRYPTRSDGPLFDWPPTARWRRPRSRSPRRAATTPPC